ncbi:hypothetical protein [Cyprinid herpesvirus 2]|nr:hypothetical protein [Cyprinid herpesvirus 2]
MASTSNNTNAASPARDQDQDVQAAVPPVPKKKQPTKRRVVKRRVVTRSTALKRKASSSSSSESEPEEPSAKRRLFVMDVDPALKLSSVRLASMADVEIVAEPIEEPIDVETAETVEPIAEPIAETVEPEPIAEPEPEPEPEPSDDDSDDSDDDEESEEREFNRRVFKMGKNLYDLAGKVSNCPDIPKAFEEARQIMLNTNKTLEECIAEAAQHVYNEECDDSDHFDFDDEEHSHDQRSVELFKSCKFIALRLMGATFRGLSGTTGLVKCTAEQLCAFLGRPIVHTDHQMFGFGTWIQIWKALLEKHSANLNSIHYLYLSDKYPASETNSSICRATTSREYCYRSLPPNQDLYNQWLTGRSIVELACNAMMIEPQYSTSNGYHHLCETVTLPELFGELRRSRLYAPHDGAAGPDTNPFAEATVPESVDLELLSLRQFSIRDKMTMKNKNMAKLGHLDVPLINESILEHVVSENHPGHILKRTGHNLMLAAHLGVQVQLSEVAPLCKHDLGIMLKNCAHADTVENNRVPGTYIDLTLYKQPKSATIKCTAVYKPTEMCKMACTDTCSQLSDTIKVLNTIELVTASGNTHVHGCDSEEDYVNVESVADVKCALEAKVEGLSHHFDRFV